MAENSGAQWCKRFPCSTSLDDLLPDFGDSCRAFISQLKKAGATVSVATTYRPVERAYLMHWCCMVGNSGQAAILPVPIQESSLLQKMPLRSNDFQGRSL